MLCLIMSFLFPLFFIPIIYSEYVVIQSHHYELNKYLKSDTKKKIYFQLICLALLVLFFVIGNKYVQYSLACISFAFSNLCFFRKHKLNITKRVKRYFVVYYFMTVLLNFALELDKLTFFVIITLLIIPYIIVTHLLSVVLENVIMSFYVRDAKKRLKGKNVIGITGSYGKTSCKNFIYDMLENECLICKTPKSYNNRVGIVKSIRENLSEEDEWFICEYGVDRKGGMDKLVKIARPNIVLITEIGPQHILTFKNIENIKIEKLKLAKSLKKDEWVILNNDNIYLEKGKEELECKVLTYGIENESDIMAKNIKIDNGGSSFDLYVYNKKVKTIKIGLLGMHNILNVLGAIGALMCMGNNLKNIDKLASLIKPVSHRLEVKNMHGVKVIDDGYNSNEVGFRMAIDVLGLMEEEKVVITPGIIEQGDNSEEVNYNLGRYMADKIDLAILVEKNAEIIKKGLLSNGFDERRIVSKKDFKEAWEYVKEINDDNKIFLIENDLPSIYLK